MYKATHAFESTADHILSFSKGEGLCVLEKSNESWWLASNAEGRVGYIPINYVVEEKDDANVALQSVNNAIEEILASSPAGNLPPQQQAVLKKLIAHKETLSTATKKSKSGSSKRRAPPPPTADMESTHSGPRGVGPPPVPERSATYKSQQVSSDQSYEAQFHDLLLNPEEEKNNKVSLACEDVPGQTPAESAPFHIPDDVGSNLLDILKTSLNPNEEKCRDALLSIISTLKNNFPSHCTLFDGILDTIPEAQFQTDQKSDKLSLALENIREIKDDAQQRNWAIEDDEDKIMEILNEILSELTTIDKEISIAALTYDRNRPIITLVEYHQMETRVALRLVILQIFGVMCSLSRSVVSTLLFSVLPLELARDMMTHVEESQRTCYSALVMSMLFSTAESIPFSHYDRLDKSFVQFLIKCIEGEVEEVAQDEQIVDMFVNVLLSFNLHMLVHSKNIILQVIAERETCTQLGEKIMMLLNRGDDPVAIEEHWNGSEETNNIFDDEGERPPPSVIKFLQDVYAQRSTSTFLYTNDMNVLLDITARNLTDLSSGSKVRTEYLELLLNILTNTEYSDNRHRCRDIGLSLHRILNEEPPDSEQEQQILDFDKRIIGKIMADYGSLFV